MYQDAWYVFGGKTIYINVSRCVVCMWRKNYIYKNVSRCAVFMWRKSCMCFVLNMCDNWNIFMILDCTIVIINLYLLCTWHLHRCFPLVPSSGEQFHLKLFLTCSVLFWVVLAIKHFCNCHTPLKGVPTLTQWWGLCGQMILRAVLAVLMLLAWNHVPERSKVVTQTKRDTLVLQVGGWAWGWRSHPVKHKKCKTLLPSYP